MGGGGLEQQKNMRILKLQSLGVMIGLLMLNSSAFCEYNITMSLQYDAYETDDSPNIKGTEIAAPFQLSYEGDAFSVALKTAYADASVDWHDDEDFELSGITDTSVSASYIYAFQTQNPTKFIINLDVNLPTGEENLTPEEVIAESELDGDLFRIDDFGEGLNVGATIRLERQIGSNTFGIYGGYTYYGAYDPWADQPEDEYNPGDEIFGGVLYEWKGSPRNIFQTYLGYSYFWVDTVDQADTLKIGDKLAGGAGLQMGLHDKLDMTLLLQYIFQFESEEAIDGNLVREPTNSNGDEFFGSLDLTYRPNPRLGMRLMGDLRYHGESDRQREDIELPYEGQRTRYAVGPGLEYRITPSILLQGSGAYFYLDCDPNISVIEPRTFQGVNADIGVTYTF